MTTCRGQSSWFPIPEGYWCTWLGGWEGGRCLSCSPAWE